MKIAIGTDDKKTIHKGHFGDSRHYLVFEILNAKVVARELRENAHTRYEKGMECHGQPQGIIELLQDCSIFMGRSFEKRSLQTIKYRGIDCILTSIEDIDWAVSSYLDGKDDGFHYYDRQEKDFIPCEARTFLNSDENKYRNLPI